MATRVKPKRDDTILSNWQTVPERAPSSVRADQPTVPRVIAMVSLFLAAVGGLALIFQGRYLVGPGWGFFFLTLGVGGLLFHAFTDRELQYRRTYMILGLGLLGLGAILRIWSKEGVRGALFLPYGVPCLGMALAFLLAAARHEEDLKWRKIIMTLIGLGGILMALAGFLASHISRTYLIGPSAPPEGLLLILLGLVFLWGFIGSRPLGDNLSYSIGILIGLLGAASILVAVTRGFWATGYFIPNGLLLTGLGVIYFLVSLGICSDSLVVVMTRRELSSFFLSPVAYLLIFGLTLIGWFMFFNFVGSLNREQVAEEPIILGYIWGFLPVATILVLVPFLTMRVLSEEKRSGTLEVLLTAPVNEIWIVLSKFIACMIFFLVSFVPWGLFLVALRVVGGEPFDFRPMLSFYLALIATGAGFVAMGVFFSSLTQNQIVSAVLTFAVLLGWTGISLFAFQAPETLGGWVDLITYSSYLGLWFNSLEGQISPRNLIFHVTLAAFFLFLTVKVLESRKWK